MRPRRRARASTGARSRSPPASKADATARRGCCRRPPSAEFLRAGGAATKLLLSPAAALRLAEVPRPAGEVQVLIGPEGGLTDEEQARAQAAGFLGVRLGPRVLRTETAAIAALALLQREFGDL